MPNGPNTFPVPPEMKRLSQEIERIRDLMEQVGQLPLKQAWNVWGWGGNHYSAMGWPSQYFPDHLFARVSIFPVPSGVTITNVAAGWGHALFLASNGSVWACGLNDRGQVGVDPTQHPVVTTVTPVEGIPDEVTDIAAGYFHSLARTRAGAIYAWGGNQCGELGIGTVLDSYKPMPVQTNTGTPLTGVRRIAAGLFFSLACMENTSVLAWGDNESTRLGVLEVGDHSSWPLPVQAPSGAAGMLTGITDVAAGMLHSLALTHEGDVYSWGNNFYLQCGRPLDPSVILSSCPAFVLPPTGSSDPRLRHIQTIAAGAFHSLALTTGGGIYAWGSNSSGQLGHRPNGQVQTATPQQVRVLASPGVEVIFTHLAAGYVHSLALGGSTAEGRQNVYGWGNNSAGQLGVNAPRVPFLVLPPADLVEEFLTTTYLQIAAGWDFSLAVEEPPVVS